MAAGEISDARGQFCAQDGNGCGSHGVYTSVVCETKSSIRRGVACTTDTTNWRDVKCNLQSSLFFNGNAFVILHFHVQKTPCSCLVCWLFFLVVIFIFFMVSFALAAQQPDATAEHMHTSHARAQSHWWSCWSHGATSAIKVICRFVIYAHFLLFGLILWCIFNILRADWWLDRMLSHESVHADTHHDRLVSNFRRATILW